MRKSLHTSRNSSSSPDVNIQKRARSDRGSSDVDFMSMLGCPPELAATAIQTLEWEVVEVMLPSCLQGKSRHEVIKLVAIELAGMSRRRINCVLNGDTLSSSSSSDTDYDSNCAESVDRKSVPSEEDEELDHALSESLSSSIRSVSESHSRSPRSTRFDERRSPKINALSYNDGDYSRSPTAHRKYSDRKRTHSPSSDCLSIPSDLHDLSPEPEQKRKILINTNVVTSHSLNVTSGIPNMQEDKEAGEEFDLYVGY